MTLEPQDARARFGVAPVMRLATADPDGQPHVVVTTFAVDGDRLYTAIDQKPKTTRNLKRLRNIQDNPKVAALTDHYDPDDWSKLWWARADGTARLLHSHEEMQRPLDLLAERYPQYQKDRPEGPVIEVTVDKWTGWAGSQ